MSYVIKREMKEGTWSPCKYGVYISSPSLPDRFITFKGTLRSAKRFVRKLQATKGVEAYPVWRSPDDL